MDALFVVLTNQLRNMLKCDSTQLVSLAEYDDGLYFDSKEYVTEKYKHLELTKIGNITLKYLNISDFMKFNKSDNLKNFGAFSIVIKFNSSYNRQVFFVYRSRKNH